MSMLPLTTVTTASPRVFLLPSHHSASPRNRAADRVITIPQEHQHSNEAIVEVSIYVAAESLQWK